MTLLFGGDVRGATLGPRLDADQAAMRAATFEFAKTLAALPPPREHRVPGRDRVRSAWHAFADFGFFGMALPRDLGGGGSDWRTFTAAAEALGYAGCDSGLLFAVSAQILACQVPLLTFGSKTQQATYFPGLLTGELIAAHAVTEPEGGSDLTQTQTRGELQGDHYVLSGRKVHVTNAPFADVYVVLAQTEPNLGAMGLTAFLVPRTTEGCRPGPHKPKAGLDGATFGEVTFSECIIPTTDRLGAPGGGMAVFNRAMAWERSLIMAPAVGRMTRQLEEAVERASAERGSGRRLFDHQVVAHQLADMKVRLETARLALYARAADLDAGRVSVESASVVKLLISEAFLASSLMALRLAGAAGYATGTDPDRDVRDALGSCFYSGVSEAQRTLIAASLLR
jgi:alkylation response protein AidB-like acyl-CoA dehydrogenase